MPNESTEEVAGKGFDKGRLRAFTCAECGETRNLLDFYDDVHKVYLTVDMGVYVDHGAGKRALEMMP